ncbi:hypothetical protein BDA96_03G374500 [Sorghum bicolor]|uniref:PTM/DIR17-like Tudor domain-containing protein n=1 Tax=Sorghum bicolor TaxID=4558 RepID=A0A921UQY9_SORBI|nr:hypothetical protein BDA96_03G374500 [Sorghum bicolor]
MEGADGKQDSETTFIVKVHREPAIIINGVPDLPSDSTAGSQSLVKIDTKPQVDPRFGGWLEGRKVQKLFGDRHYVGKVAKYDSESNWYNIIYDDGDQEDLEWRELEEILLPLDITVPLKTLVMDKCKLKGSVSDFSKPKVGRPRKMYATMDDSMKKTSHAVAISQGNDANNQMAGLLPASMPNDMSGQLVTVITEGNAQARLQASNQPRKRGRPRKHIIPLPANIQPKKRGRPPKNRNPQGAEKAPDSLALVPVQDDTQESSRNQNSALIRNAMTARAEKLKRENLRAQSTRSGTRLF